jgi:hypothetical protein
VVVGGMGDVVRLPTRRVLLVLLTVQLTPTLLTKEEQEFQVVVCATFSSYNYNSNLREFLAFSSYNYNFNLCEFPAFSSYNYNKFSC